ncbi:MAG: MATE family efflux transporter [Oscillospiraceae bacterium]|nr:MATE family efflux transporter [Oscillospiraceae bacterium]
MSTGKSMINDLTEGSVTRKLLAFAAPLFVSNALQAVYNLVDMVVVGQFIGGAGMSAVSIGGDLLHLLTFVAMGFSSAGQVLIAQSVGAGEMQRVRKTIGTMFSFMLSAGLVIALLCYVIRVPLLAWLNTPDESYAYTMDYTVTCITGLVFIYGYNLVSAILRGMGDSKRPFLFVAIAAVLNMALDVLFVVVFRMAVFGAALATVIGQGVSFLFSVAYLYRHRDSFAFDFRLRSFRPDRDALRRLVNLGVPMAIQSAAISFSKIVLMSWINASGVVYSALAGIYNKINTIVAVVSNAFTTAGSTMVGQNLGAGKTERVPKILRTIAAITLSICLVLSLVLLLAGRQVFGVFTGDEAVLAVSAVLVGPCVLNFFGSATRSVAFAIINGSGNTRLNLAVALIDGMISRIGFAALLGFGLGLGCQGFWYGDALAGCVPIMIGGAYLLSGRWKSAGRYRA